MQPQTAVPAPPSATAGRTGRRVWAIVAGALAFVLLAGAAVVTLLVVKDRSATPFPEAVPPAVADLADALVDLDTVPGAHYTGTYTSAQLGRLQADIQVTNEGTGLSTLTSASGQEIQVLDAGGRTFLKAPASIWTKVGESSERANTFAAHWVRANEDDVALSLGDLVGPAQLADRIAPALFDEDAVDTPIEASLAGKSTVDGQEVEEIVSGGMRLYITTAEPHRIVRIASDQVTTPAGTPTRAMRLANVTGAAQRFSDEGDSFELDLGELTDDAVDAEQEAMQQQVEDLVDSIDPAVDFNLDGDIVLNPCTPYGCLATVTVSNTVRPHSTDVSVDTPVTVVGNITMTLDGRPVADCPINTQMPPNGSITLECQASYVLPPEENPTTHQVYAEVAVSAQAVSQADIDAINNELNAELDRRKRRRVKGPTGTPVQYPCLSPAAGESSGGPGGWQPSTRNPSPKARWPYYQEQISGVRRGSEYAYNGRDFDGFRLDGSDPVFLEAKDRIAFLLLALKVQDDGTAVIDTGMSEKAQKLARVKTDELLRELEGHATATSGTANARIEWSFAEEESMKKVQAFARTKLSADEFAKFSWKFVPFDPTFAGCP